MVCGFGGQEQPQNSPADGSSAPPAVDTGEPAAEPSTSAIDIGGSAGESAPTIDIGGSAGESVPVVDIGGSAGESTPVVDIGGSTSESPVDVDIGSSVAGSSVDVDIGASTSQATHDILDDIFAPSPDSTTSDTVEAGETGTETGESSSTDGAKDNTSSEGGEPEPSTEAASPTEGTSNTEPEPDTASTEPEPDTASTEPTTPEAKPTETKNGSGLSGPVISSGLEMLLMNGVKLPFPLPDINLPAVDLATVHLPDMTFDGIAITGIPLPSVTLPPMNPASLTDFNYIEDIMSRAGITFDDLAKLPLPDINHLDISELSNIDVAGVMSLMNVNRVSQGNQASAQDLVKTLPPDPSVPHTTTLDADGIDALLGLSAITYSTN